MLTLTQFIVYSFAIWRISNLFVNEGGPWLVFKSIREWSGIQHDDGGQPFLIPDNITAQALSCVWCMSLWIGFFFTIFLLIFPVISYYVAVTFAFSTLAILIDTYIKARK